MKADLAGIWRLAPADEELRRTFAEPTLEDDGWEQAHVPGHWQSVPAYVDHEGPFLYRHRFEGSGAGGHSRQWLVFDGIFYQGDAWLDGSYLGATEGYFAPNAFDVTEHLGASKEHTVAVEVACSPQSDTNHKRNLTGVFQHWDCAPTGFNPGGIWRGVRIEETGPVRIVSMRVRCTSANEDQARLELSAVLDAAEAMPVELRTEVSPLSQNLVRVAEQTLTHGINKVNWRIDIRHPPLWWPWSMGSQPLVALEFSVTPLDGPMSHSVVRRTGLRRVRMDSMTFEVNGRRLFLKGVSMGPSRMAIGEAPAAELVGDVMAAREAGLDMVRVHGHITRPEVYDAADELGMVLWQDLPLQWRYHRQVRAEAVRQAGEAVNVLGHHPSIGIWCAHNEPVPIAPQPDPSDKQTSNTGLSSMARHFLPCWNRTVLDTSVSRALDKADGSRPVVTSSGLLPVTVGQSDTHLTLGWYRGAARDLAPLLARWPKLGRFVGGFGAQAMPPDSPEWVGADRWPDLEWERLARDHNLQPQVLFQWVPPGAHTTYESWRDATQHYQAELLRTYIEILRRLKYRPTGGFCAFLLADAHPAASWSVLDHHRKPKAGYDALKAACAPVLLTAWPPKASYQPGQRLELAVHIVSDLRVRLAPARTVAEVVWDGGSAEWKWEGTVEPDSVALVGHLALDIPDRPGPLEIRLRMSSTDASAASRYTSRIEG